MKARALPALAAAVALLMTAGAVQAQDENRIVEDGGIKVQGWMGKVDAAEAANGATLDQARLAMDGGALHVMTGPAVVYWRPVDTATGNYTVSATFREPEYMNLNNHPHPYGLFIAGSGLDGAAPKMLYCAAYGDGRFIMRGFGDEAFRLNGRGEVHDAINKAAGRNQPVTQQIAMSVRGDTVTCSINGTVVGSYAKSDVVAAGRLGSTDGIVGLRFGHNTEVMVSDFTVTKN